MKASKQLKFFPLISCLLLSPLSHAQAQGAVDIKVMAEARVFANFTDELPAVLNYFVNASEQEVIEFYQQAYGEPLTQERKRGRLTLQFSQAEKNIRVVISTQNNHRQVDILVEKNN